MKGETDLFFSCLMRAVAVRRTTHLYVETNLGEIFVVSSLAIRLDTQLIRIDGTTGRVIYNGKIGEDLFLTEDDAIHFLKEHRKLSFKTEIRFDALIGLTIIKDASYIIISTKVRKEMDLFGGHTVNTIAETNWIRIPLRYPSVDQCNEPKVRIQDFPIDGLHYYCDTFDITHPFPSAQRLSDYHPEFCWNDYLVEPFARVGLRMWCIVMMQGMAVSRCCVPDIEPSTDGESASKQVNVCVFTRKSRINPGTRYTARGLNKEGGPGNECECELLIWTKDDSNDVNWLSYVWRRGTVPVWWRTTLKSSVSGPEIEVRPDDPFQGCEKYYSRLLERYGPNEVILLNTLRCDPDQKEVLLSEAYQESLKYVKGLVNIKLRMIKFDWHHTLKQLGPERTAEGLWSLLKTALRTTGLSSGTIQFEEISEDMNMSIQEWQQLCPDRTFACHTIQEQQNGIIRFNCADSLDRTNIATFFVSLQLAAEMLRRFGIGLRKSLCAKKGYNLEESWSLIRSPLSLLRKIVFETVIEIVTELFVFNGDVIAMLYTNSLAMHSGLMREFSKHVSSAPVNALIAIKRRIQNVMNDTDRQLQYELLLGLHTEKNILGKEKNRVTLLTSQENVWIVNQVPRMFKQLSPNILFAPRDNFSWFCPDKVNEVEIIVYLAQPSRVTEVSLVLSHGQCEEMSPLLIDAYVGEYMDTMRVIFQNRQIPRCSNGTKVYYSLLPLAEPSNRLRPAHRLYDFHRTDPHTRDLSRVVRFVFKGEGVGRLTLGKIEVFGSFSAPPESPQHEYSVYKQKRANNIIDSVVQTLTTVGDEDKSSSSRLSSGMRGYSENHSDTDIEEYVTISINSAVDSHVSNVTDEYINEEEPTKFSSFRNSLFGGNSSSKKTPRVPSPLRDISSPKRSVLDKTSIIEDYSGNIIKSRMNFEQESQPKVVIVQDSETTEAPPLRCAEQLSGNVHEQYKQLAKLKKRGRRNKSYEIEGVHTERPIFTLLDQLELEHFRLSSGISTTERDLLLQEIGIPVLLCDPTHTIHLRSQDNELQLRKIINASEPCHKCKQTIKLFQNRLQCFYCRYYYCSNCIYSQQINIPEFSWNRACPVCVDCYENIREQKAYIPAILALNSSISATTSSRHRSRFILSVQRAALCPTTVTFSSSQLHVPVSDYPHSGILMSVPTDVNSFPIESILMPPHLLQNRMFWYAPRGVTELELYVVMGSDVFVSEIVLLVDSLGYNHEDVPSFKIYCGNTIDELVFLEEWQLPSSGVNPNETLSLRLKQPEQCRLIRFDMKLPRLKYSDDVTLSIEDGSAPFFHLGRLRVFGHPLSSVTARNIDPSEHRAYRAFTRFTSPEHNRIQIKASATQWNKEKTKLEIKSPSGIKIIGFNLFVRHDEMYGVASQVKLIRVYGISSYGKKKIQFRTAHELQTFVIPKVRPNVRLSFNFVADVSSFHTFSFEFLTSYGGRSFVPCPCKVILYRDNVS